MGFTLLELMIVVAIVAILASVGVPQYVSALRVARIGKARQELVTIAQAVDSYTATHGGQVPLTLVQVGFGGKRDPWGLPYCFLNYGTGTGDGLDWAVRAGLVDPSAVKSSGSGGSGGELAPSRGSVLPLDAAWQLPAPVAAAPVDTLAAVQSTVSAIVSAVPRTVERPEVEDLAASLVRARSFTVFAGVPSETTRRRDRYLFPLNTDYDLFSLGADGCTSVSLGEAVGQDDVIRANNGGFFGLASEY